MKGETARVAGFGQRWDDFPRPESLPDGKPQRRKCAVSGTAAWRLVPAGSLPRPPEVAVQRFRTGMVVLHVFGRWCGRGRGRSSCLYRQPLRWSTACQCRPTASDLPRVPRSRRSPSRFARHAPECASPHTDDLQYSAPTRHIIRRTIEYPSTSSGMPVCSGTAFVHASISSCSTSSTSSEYPS